MDAIPLHVWVESAGLYISIFHITDVFDWVAAPDLHRRDHSSWWHNTIWSNYASSLQDSALHDNSVASNEDIIVNCTTVEGAIWLYDDIALDTKESRHAIWNTGSSK